MSLNIKNKQKIITEINEIAKYALSAVVVNPHGITVNKITELRKVGREIGIYMRVVRNTLLYRAVKGTVFECLKDTCVGPTLIACSMRHPADAARVFEKLSKMNIQFEIKAVAYAGKLMSASKIHYLATLPTYEEAIIRLIATIKEFSIGKLMRFLFALRKMKEIT